MGSAKAMILTQSYYNNDGDDTLISGGSTVEDTMDGGNGF